MSKFDVVRAWKDAEYRQSLSAEEQALLPEHPAGSVELVDEQLAQVAGGTDTVASCVLVICNYSPLCIPTPVLTQE